MGKKTAKIEANFSDLIKLEQEKYYLCVYEEVVSINGRFVGNYDSIYKNYLKLAESLSIAAKEAKKSSEYTDAINGMRSMLILPFRIH